MYICMHVCVCMCVRMYITCASLGSSMCNFFSKSWKGFEMDSMKERPCLDTLKDFLKSDKKLSFVKVLGITFELLKIV